MSNIEIFRPVLSEHKDKAIYWAQLPGASLALAISNAMQANQKPILIITPDSLAASQLIEEIIFFSRDKYALHYLPGWETLPYDHFSPHQDIISERLACLSLLPSLTSGVLILSVDTLLQRLPPTDYIDGQCFVLSVNDKLNIDILRTKLVRAGYHSTNQVREHGEFSVRGSLIDIFPMGASTPFRIDLLDNEIDSIRVFSPDTQRTIEKTSSIRLLPAKEFPLNEEAIERFRQAFRNRFAGNPQKSSIYQDISEGICPPGIEYYLPLFFEKTATLFDYLPKDLSIITFANTTEKAQEYWREITLRYEQGRHDISKPLAPPEQLFMSVAVLEKNINQYPHVTVINQDTIIKENIKDVIAYQVSHSPELVIDHKAVTPLNALQQFLTENTDRILFCVESMGRREIILNLLASIQITPSFFATFEDFINSDKKYGIAIAPIEAGFKLHQPAITLIAESQLYGKRVIQSRSRKKASLDPDALIRDLTELEINDPIVHIDHGVGRYRGLETLTVGNQVAEYLCLTYQNEDKLFVPVSSLHYVSRYMGSDPENAPINKLGTEQWQKAKRRAAEKVCDVAAELLDLYAKRAAKPGHCYQIAPEMYEKFIADFPFEETPDQLRAIEQVFADMTSDKPMDRVICGDVGFGKTEVAMRATFLAVQNNKQVVILVPTTLLAQQHYQNFLDRFADWPIQIEVLSRFRSAKEQTSILERLENGKVDIIIGTHKLIQTGIKFKDLGLIIVDEEHRFGVKQKEKIKALRTEIDILTLTATPIPRTLNMALSGIRDLSVIATPPARRLSIKTFVHDYQDSIIIEAIQREILRGGQVYFLHNDITTINKKAEEIAKLVHEARPSVAHGQMHERDLEKIMSDFYHRHSNVLVCSTIIESGIDVPSANTIIINRADKFGIAQLHQLRGRVGRSHHQAYAYLLIPGRKNITNDAIKRLEAISAYDDLGIGFTLSTHDLEIRGAGELLGEQQSGDMQEIGFTLYMDLLSRAVAALKSGETFDPDTSLLYKRSEIDLHLTALIPEDYLPDIQMRLQCYKKIANAKVPAELDEIQVDMIDRFGLTPQPLKNLFQVTELKLKADTLGIIKIEANDIGGKFDFNQKPNINPETIISLIQQKSGQFKLEGPNRLRFTLEKHPIEQRINLIDDLLKVLGR